MSGSITVQIQGEGLKVSEDTAGFDPTGSTPSPRESEGVARLVGILSDSLERLRPIAPRVATLLSGGIDSSLLAVVARDRLSVCDTYSTSYPFENPATNFEQEYALSAACALSTRHTLFTPTVADFVRGVVEALASAETPLCHLQSVLLHLLFKAGVPERLDTILCGEGVGAAFGLDTQLNCITPAYVRDSAPPHRLGMPPCVPWATAGPGQGTSVKAWSSSSACDCLFPIHFIRFGTFPGTGTSSGSGLITALRWKRSSHRGVPISNPLPIGSLMM